MYRCIAIEATCCGPTPSVSCAAGNFHKPAQTWARHHVSKSRPAQRPRQRRQLHAMLGGVVENRGKKHAEYEWYYLYEHCRNTLQNTGVIIYDYFLGTRFRIRVLLYMITFLEHASEYEWYYLYEHCRNTLQNTGVIIYDYFLGARFRIRVVLSIRTL